MKKSVLRTVAEYALPMQDRRRRTRVPWWCSGGARPTSIVRMDAECLGLRVQLASGERVTMPLGTTTFKPGWTSK